MAVGFFHALVGLNLEHIQGLQAGCCSLTGSRFIVWIINNTGIHIWMIISGSIAFVTAIVKAPFFTCTVIYKRSIIYKDIAGFI